MKGRVRLINNRNLEFNALWDGLFHISTYLFTATCMTILARRAFQPHAPWSGKMLVGAMLMGFGIFNVVEGLIDHHLLGIHHVNETAPPRAMDFLGFRLFALGSTMLVGGWLLWRPGKRDTAMAAGTAA